jgi:hypothetical protein
VLDFSGSRIIFRMNGGVALDMTGSVGVTVYQPHFIGFRRKDDLNVDELNPELIPAVGILLSRNEQAGDQPSEDEPTDEPQTDNEQTNQIDPPVANRHIFWQD